VLGEEKDAFDTAAEEGMRNHHDAPGGKSRKNSRASQAPKTALLKKAKNVLSMPKRESVPR